MNALRLRHRLLLFGLLPSALLALVLVAYYTVTGIHALDGELRERGLAVVRYLGPVSEYGVISGNLEALQSLAHAVVQQPGVKAAIVVNRAGRTLAVSGRVSLSSEQLRRIPESPGVISDAEQWIAFGAPIQRSLAESDLLFDPLGGKATPEGIGQIFVEFDKKEVALRQDELLRRGLLIVGVGLLLVAIIAFGVADGLARPMDRMVAAVRALARGEFETRIPLSSGAEFGEFEQGFNAMAERVAEVHRGLQERIEEATAQLAFQARHDPLTGLVNRREFEARLEKAIATVQAGSGECALMFVDLDHFKPVNDSCGHLAGDELLRQISRLFQGRLREEDSLARLGGDEFGILLQNCPSARAQQVAQDFCTMASAYRFIWHDRIFSVGASVGLAAISRQIRSVAELIGAADAACYAAKDKGRNRVCVYDGGGAVNRRQPDLSWQERIRAALTGESLLFEAYPLRHLGDGDSVPYVEVRVCLEERPGARVPMTVLMDAAERYGLSPELDLRLARTAASALARARDQGRSMRCLVPLSTATVRSPESLPALVALLQSRGLRGSELGLLISEETAVQHNAQTVAFCQAARRAGCFIVLGDFGGGFSSFSHLHSIAPQGVRISRSLTRDIGSSRSALALVRAVEEIARDMQIETIAEGIDDVATARLIAEVGIDYAQGGAAGAVVDFSRWVEEAVARGA